MFLYYCENYFHHVRASKQYCVFYRACKQNYKSTYLFINSIIIYIFCAPRVDFSCIIQGDFCSFIALVVSVNIGVQSLRQYALYFFFFQNFHCHNSINFAYEKFSFLLIKNVSFGIFLWRPYVARIALLCHKNGLSQWPSNFLHVARTALYHFQLVRQKCFTMKITVLKTWYKQITRIIWEIIDHLVTWQLGEVNAGSHPSRVGELLQCQHLCFLRE